MMMLHNRWKVCEIQISVSINKDLLKHIHTHWFPSLFVCFHGIMTELSNGDRDQMFPANPNKAGGRWPPKCLTLTAIQWASTGLAGLGLHLAIHGACGASWVSAVGEPLGLEIKGTYLPWRKWRGNRDAQIQASVISASITGDERVKAEAWKSGWEARGGTEAGWKNRVSR